MIVIFLAHILLNEHFNDAPLLIIISVLSTLLGHFPIIVVRVAKSKRRSEKAVPRSNLLLDRITFERKRF